MDISNFSINVMSLLAFGTCLGTLIANALIIIESVSEHLQMGKDSVQAAVDGTKEVLLAVIAASGTNLVVFTPMAFMGGVIGKFMLQFGLTVVYATLFSILASITLTPMLCGLLLKPANSSKGIFQKLTKYVDKLLEISTEVYKSWFKFMMKHPIVSTVAVIAFFLTISFPAKRLGNEFIPKSDRDDFHVYIAMPDGTPVQKTAEITKQIGEKILKYPEVQSTLANVGYDGEERSRISATLIPASNRNRSYKDLLQDLLPFVARIPEAEIVLNGGDRTPSNDGDITVDVKGRTFSDSKKIANQMQDIMKNSGYFGSIESSYRIPKMEIQFQPTPQKVIQQNLNNAKLGQVIRALVNGNDDSVYKENGEEYDINITLAQDFKRDIADFDQFLIHGKDGLIPISSLGDVRLTEATSPLKRRDKSQIIQLKGYLVKSTAGPVMAELATKFKNINFSNGASYAFSGQAENQNESQQELGKAFFLAVILTYMLLVAILDSFVFPISIGSAILTSFLGSFLLMFFTDQSINIGSMMAIVMVVGLAVNNAILMIEFTQQKLQEGHDIEEALWLGASKKLKAILMTSIAIIAGALPQLFDFDKIKSAMGAVIIGGMLGSLFFTYFFVPLVHLLVFKIKTALVKKTVQQSPSPLL